MCIGLFVHMHFTFYMHVRYLLYNYRIFYYVSSNITYYVLAYYIIIRYYITYHVILLVMYMNIKYISASCKDMIIFISYYLQARSL